MCIETVSDDVKLEASSLLMPLGCNGVYLNEIYVPTIEHLSKPFVKQSLDLIAQRESVI